MADRNTRLRWCGNNFTESAGTTLTVSSSQTLFPSTNLQDPKRFKMWSPKGTFIIDSTNKTIHYHSGGSDYSTDIATGTYTGAELAAEIESTLLNGTFTVSYTNNTFTLARSGGSFSLYITTTTTAMWDVLGFTGSSDLTGSASYEANQARNHNYEHITWDLGAATTITFFSLIGKKSEGFTLSSTATVTLQADNVPFSVGVTPDFERSLTVTPQGIFEFLDDADDTSYRYWRVIIKDRTNPLGPEGLKFGVAYLGDYITLSQRGLVRGFTKTLIDPSLKNTSESGAVYYKQKPKYWMIRGMTTPFLTAADRAELEQFAYDKGASIPFFISLDPTLAISTEISELTMYVRFESDLVFTHDKTNVYSMAFSVVEDL